MSGVLVHRRGPRIRRTCARRSDACSAPARGALWPRSAASGGRPAIGPAETQKHAESANTRRLTARPSKKNKRLLTSRRQRNPRAQRDSLTHQSGLGKKTLVSLGSAGRVYRHVPRASLYKRLQTHKRIVIPGSLSLCWWGCRNTHPERNKDKWHVRHDTLSHQETKRSRVSLLM